MEENVPATQASLKNKVTGFTRKVKPPRRDLASS
jgi:hypothetical protein